MVIVNCDNQRTVLISRRLALLVLAAILTSLGCHAQTKIETGAQLPLSVTHRIAVLLRQKAQLPPGSTITIGPAQPSDVNGYHTITVTLTADDKTSHPINFLISDDGKTIAQFVKYDLSADPRTLVSDAGRPARGGPSSAPVIIVNFDDLECPFCARLHETIFPALTQRYGDTVRIVYKDFPLDQHPWAMHAAVDVNCLAAQSPAGYWNLIDYIHSHAAEIGTDPGAAKADDAKPAKSDKPDKPEHTLDRANAQLDKLTRDQGAFQKVNAATLDACIVKQDPSAIEASKMLGASLNVESTPSMFINGEKIEGALPLDYIFARIDDALRAEGATPPPPYVAPAPAAPAAPAAPKPAPTAAKPAPTR
jgi:protein-disulfide isomerase